MAIDDVEWIRGREAKRMLAQAGETPSELLLRQAARIGKVRARATEAIIQPSGRNSQKRSYQEWDVPAKVWFGTQENSLLSIDRDNYSSSAPEHRLGLVKLTGLSFCKADLIAHFELDRPRQPQPQASQQPASSPASRPGRGVDTEKWGTLVAAITAFQFEHGIDTAWTASAFHDRLKSFIVERGGQDSDIPHYSKCSRALTRALWWAAGHEGEPDT